MKLFIKKIFVFLAILLLMMCPIFLLFVNHQSNLFSSYKIKSEVAIIYLGDSHIQNAVNDRLIPKSMNLGKDSESFYFTYFKLKMLLANNSSIKHIYLGLSHNSLSNYYDRFISGDYSSIIGPRYFHILPKAEKFKIIFWNRSNLLILLRGIIEEGLEMVYYKNKPSIMYGFTNPFEGTKAVKSSMDKRILFQYYKNEELNPFSEINIRYLEKIINLCKTKGIALTALNSPVHDYYFNLVPLIYKRKFDEIVRENDLKFIDLSNLNLNDECFIPDGDHVSFSGSIKTSVELLKIINKNK